jgi:hypothetical protein
MTVLRQFSDYFARITKPAGGRRHAFRCSSDSFPSAYGTAGQKQRGTYVSQSAGQAAPSSAAFRKLDDDGQNALIEFLKPLQILPPGTPCLVVDENYSCRER